MRIWQPATKIGLRIPHGGLIIISWFEAELFSSFPAFHCLFFSSLSLTSINLQYFISWINSLAIQAIEMWIYFFSSIHTSKVYLHSRWTEVTLLVRCITTVLPASSPQWENAKQTPRVHVGARSMWRAGVSHASAVSHLWASGGGSGHVVQEGPGGCPGPFPETGEKQHQII